MRRASRAARTSVPDSVDPDDPVDSAGHAGMSTPTGPAVGRFVPGRVATRLGVGAAVALVLVPFASALIAWRRGWMPTSDWASVVIRAWDTLAGSPPLVGIYSSATTSGGHTRNVYHPGPLQEWLLAGPVHLFAPSTLGALVGSAALVAACITVVFVVAWRRGGSAMLWGAVGVVALFMLATGPAMLREPLHTPLATFAMLAFLAAAWAVLDHDDWFWPVAVFFASLAGQAQVAFLVPAVVVAVVIVGFRGVDAWRRRPRPPAVGSSSGRGRRVVGVTTVGVAVACWAAPLFDQFFRSGNLWALVATGNGGKPIGASWALSELAKTLAVPPSWIFRDLHLSVVVIGDTHVVWHTSTLEWVSAALVTVAFVAALWRAFRKGPVVVKASGVVATAALAGCFLASAIMPDDPFGMLGHREVWRSAGLFTWWFLGLAAIDVLRPVVGRLPRVSSRSLHRLAAVASAALAVVAVAVTVARSSPAHDTGSVGFGGVEAFTAVATPACDAGPVAVQPTTLVDTPTALGLIAMLDLRGCDVRAVGLDNILPGPRHRPTGSEPTRFTIDGFPIVPEGCHLAATYDPAHPPPRYRDFTSTLDRLQRGGAMYLFACPH